LAAHSVDSNQTFYERLALKAVNLHEFRLLLENTAIKQVRAQRAPMSKAWNLVFQCPGGDYALHETPGEPRAFEDLHDAVEELGEILTTRVPGN